MPAPAAGLGLLLLMASLVIAGGSAAVTLGEIETTSSLGQPFAGAVRIEAAAGEVIRRECFSPGPEFAAIPGIPRIEDVRFRLEQRAGVNILRVASLLPVREPLAQFILQLRCPGLPSITRSFVVLLDPASMLPVNEFTPVLSAPRSVSAPTPRQARAPAVPGGDIAPGSRYTVRAGDTLSGIASRIAGRPSYSVWPLARRIQRGNPGAFENGRPDRLIAGATLTIPTLAPDLIRSPGAAGRTSPAARASGTAGRRPVTDPQRSTRQVFTPAPPPVVTGTVISTSAAELDYLVLTPVLSDLSRSRIRQRAAQSAKPPGPASVETAPTPELTEQPAATQPQPAAGPQQASDAGWSSWWWWALLLGALTMVLAATSLFFFRMRQPAAEGGAEETPWEVDDTGASDEEMVYDDFEGTFVPKNAAALSIDGKDPEDEIQTHLMPALGDPGAQPSAQGDPDAASLETPTTPTTGTGEAEFPKLPDRAADEAPGTVVETFEVAEDELDTGGWVDLDFEATQILEQDYLAEYAASLKERVKEQSGAHQHLPESDDSGADAGEVLLEASDLMESLEEEAAEGEEDEDAGSDLPAADDATVLSLSPMDDQEETTTLTLEDNVVAIDGGKNTATGGDQDEGDGKAKGSTKKS